MPRSLLVVLALALLACASPASAAPFPPGFEEQTLISGLSQPMAVDWTPDGRTLIVEKAGRLKVALPGSTTATTVFDYSARVNDYHDRGALGLAVDADFATNRYVYLLYTYDLNQLATDGGGEMVSQLLRVQLSPTNVVSDEKVLLGSYTQGPCPAASNTVDCIPSDYDSHSIGTVRSGPDGTLYVGSGDGSSYNQADRRALRAYDERSLAGKIVRIDREGRGVAGHPYCASTTDLSQVCTKVFVKGLRNPFRFELRPSGGLAIGDVGWNTTEELNLAPAGGNRSYGWPCLEGTARTPGYSSFSECTAEYAKPAGTHTAPDASWCHCGSGASSLGGPTYRGDQYPAGYRDSIFYGDYAKRFIMRRDSDGVEHDFAEDWMGVQLATAPNGDLTYVTPGDFGPGDGSVVAIRYAAGNRAPEARIVADRTSGPAPLTVAFDGTTSTDPEAETLTYAWNFGDGTTSTAAKPAKTYATAGTYTASLTVTDPRGRSASSSITITAGDSAPTATITAPTAALKYRAGVPLTLTGVGADAQDGANVALTWRIVLNHNDHVHPLTDLQGASATFTPRDDHDADSFYEITLTARDSAGLTGSATVQVRPETVPLALASQPAGAPVSWAGTQLTAPYSATTAVGFKAGVDAAERFTSAGKTYVFDRWSDGGERTHQVTVGASAVALTAIYREEVAPPAGPVVALAFDETSGTRAGDASGKANHATLSGGAKFVTTGRTRGAADFDGVNDIATIPDNASLDLTGPLTMEAWVRPRTRTGWQSLLFKALPGWQSYVLYAAADPYAGLGKGGEPVGFVDEDGVRGPGALPLNAWSHLATTYDGAVQRLYVDGALVASRARTGPVTAGDGPLTIGGNPVWGEHLNGAVDDVRVYGRALSAAEIAADRDTPVGAAAPDPDPQPTGPVPVAAYGFEEASGTTTADSSPNKATATVVGATRLATGKVGRALTFDGVNDRVSAPNTSFLQLTGAKTLSAWVRPSSTTGWRTVLLKETGTFQSYALYGAADPYAGSGAGGEPAGFAAGEGVRGPAKLPTGTWSHLAMTYDGTTARLYRDGTLVASRAMTVSPITGTGPLSIGGNVVWGEFFAGAIDEVRVFDTALSATEVRADMDRTVATAAARGRRAFSLSRRGAAVRRAAQRRPAAKRAVKVLRGERAAIRRRARR